MISYQAIFFKRMRAAAILLAALAMPATLSAQEADCGCGDGSGGGYGGYDSGCGVYEEYGLRRPIWKEGTLACPLPQLVYRSPLETWYVSTDALALKRDADDVAFAARDTADNIVLSTDDLRDEFRAGLKILIGRRISDCFAVEFSYFGLFDWDASAAVRDATLNADATNGNLFSPFTNFGNPATVGLDFNELASIRNQSSLDNGEFNLRQYLAMPNWPKARASILYGLRVVELNERFEYRTESQSPAAGGSSVSLDVDADNDLIGFQLGGAVEFQVERRAWINLEAKAALCHNNASQSTSGTLTGLPAVVAATRGEDRTALVGDISLALLYRFSPSLVGRVGYQSIWIEGVALASENFQTDVNLLTLGPPQLNHSGSILYHGPFAGLTWTW